MVDSTFYRQSRGASLPLRRNPGGRGVLGRARIFLGGFHFLPTIARGTPSASEKFRREGNLGRARIFLGGILLSIDTIARKCLFRFEEFPAAGAFGAGADFLWRNSAFYRCNRAGRPFRFGEIPAAGAFGAGADFLWRNSAFYRSNRAGHPSRLGEIPAAGAFWARTDFL